MGGGGGKADAGCVACLRCEATTAPASRNDSSPDRSRTPTGNNLETARVHAVLAEGRTSSIPHLGKRSIPMVWKVRLRDVTLSITAVSLLAVIPYLSTLHSYFLGDDFGLVALYSQKDWAHFGQLFWMSWTEDIYGQTLDELRPTVAFSYWLDSIFGPGSPLPYHVDNVVLHVLTALLVLGTARLAAGATWPGAAFAAVLFALLPAHAETVSWISGRADSIAALFYLGAFLAYVAWQRVGGWLLYGLSLASFFLALYSKQSAITMIATLAAYDMLVNRGLNRSHLRVLSAYVPFALLTVGHLAQRYLLFGHAVRESQITTDLLLGIGTHQFRQFQILLFGGQWLPNPPVVAGTALMLAILTIILLEMWRAFRGRPTSLAAQLLFFGPLWWTIQTAPLLVTYSAGRHLYLASVGPAILLALCLDVMFRASSNRRRVMASSLASLVVLVALMRLLPAVEAWNQSARLSEIIQRDVEREATAAPPGSLLLVAAPVAATNKAAFTWVWSWVAPFAYRPPFTARNFTQRVRFVDALLVSCCQRDWVSSIRNTVEEWSTQPDRPPIVVLVWNADTGVLNRGSDVNDPTLREHVLTLLSSPSTSKADACAWFRGLARRFESEADPCMEDDPMFYETFYDRAH
jgi:hypothetical protein